MRYGQEPSLALFAGMDVSTMRRQFSGELRGGLDLAGTVLAVLDQDDADEAIRQWLYGQRLRVRPEPFGKQLGLFPRT